MNQALLAAQKLLTDINDIQPTISVKGLVDTSTTIKEMKKNAGVVIAALTPVNSSFEVIVASRREDMISTLKELIERLPLETPEEDVTEEQLLTMGAAVESLHERYCEYVSCKESYKRLFRHNVNTQVSGDGYASN